METELISVIVPVYNVERYLRRCVDSILHQTYQDLEVLLVDDGSTDASGAICDEYAAREERVTAVHQKNGGLSAARNTGLERAKGTYLCFVDSDDFLDSRMLETLCRDLQEQNADVAVVGFRMFEREEELAPAELTVPVQCMTGREAIRSTLVSDELGDFAWNKLYKRELFRDIRYPLGRMMEDQGTTYRIFQQCSKVVYCPVPAEQEAEADTVAEKPVEAETPVESPKKQKKKHVRKQKKQPEAIAEPKTEAVNDDFTDSAFGPDIPEINISNEALAASVREAEAMGAAIMGDLKAAKVPVETMFGINEELSSYGSKKNKRAKSKVASDEDFYWYNKEDAADRPARRPIEAYYHHFNIADDCIEDLLVEMYDCALVRTEEIRYIAYGIEPRTLTMKEIMSGAVSLNDHKKKEPTEQDLVRIYEKWCGYVDHLLDKVEIHADEYTIQEIRKQLCAYGRNDVDTLLEGK